MIEYLPMTPMTLNSVTNTVKSKNTVAVEQQLIWVILWLGGWLLR